MMRSARTSPSKSIRFAAALVGVFTGVSGCQLPAPKHELSRQEATQRWNHVRAQVKTQLAGQQMEGGLFAEAGASASEAIALDPTNANAYVLLAKAHLEQGKSASAESVLSAAAKHSVTHPDLFYLRAVTLELQDRTQEALQEYQRAHELDHGNIDYLLARAECLMELDRTAEALELLDREAPKLDSPAGVYALAGHACERLRDHEGAAVRYRQALAIVPGDQVVRGQLAALLTGLQRYDEAIAVLEPLLAEQHEGDVRWRTLLAQCLLAKREPAKVISLLENLMKDGRADRGALFILAQAALEQNDLLTARQALARIQESQPNAPQAILLHAMLLWKKGDLGGSALLLREFLNHDPTDAGACCLLATVLAEHNDLEAAEEFAARANDGSPVHACTLPRSIMSRPAETIQR